MRQNYMRYIRWAAMMVVLVFLSGCAKDDAPDISSLFPEGSYNNPGGQKGMQDGLAIGTVRSRDGVRFIRLDEKSCSQVMNPKEIAIEQGGLSLLNFEEAFPADAIKSATYKSDPMDIATDWMTSLEDGFLTLHYMIPTSGEKKHQFGLYQSMYDHTLFYLIHHADGDTKGSVMDGIVCFDVSRILPKTEGKTVKLSFAYIDLNHTEKRLTFDYCSPK